MAIKAKQIRIEALSLSPTEGTFLTDKLISNLNHPNPEIVTIWKSEIEKRLRNLKTGTVRAIPLSEVLASYRKRKDKFSQP